MIVLYFRAYFLKKLAYAGLRDFYMYDHVLSDAPGRCKSHGMGV